MCPDHPNDSDPEATMPFGGAPSNPAPSDPTPPPMDATMATPTPAPEQDQNEDATIALPAADANDAPATNPVTTGDTTGGFHQATGEGSVPFTPVRDMTAGSLEKAKAQPGSSDGPRSVGHRFANRFEVVDVLGEGGMGKVFRVRDTQIDDREMALKVLRPKYSNNLQFRQLFTKEIHAAQNFVSEHVVQIRDTGQTADNQLFLTMDMVSGEDLHELLKREKVLLPRHAMEITRQTLLGLHSGHEQGFIHRDIKPSNVMLSASVPKTDQNPYGVGVQLLDFGIAGIAAEVSGQIAGTPAYMSPEQAQGQRLDVRSDLFTVGVMLFEMLTGTRPFEGKTLEDVVSSLLETQISTLIAELKHLGRPMQKILTKALQKDREKRYQNAQEFIRAIEKSKVFKMPSELPAGTALVLGVSLLAALGQGAYIWTNKDSSQERLTALESKLNDERTGWNNDRESLKDTARKEARKAEDQHQEAIAQKDKELLAADNAQKETVALLEKKQQDFDDLQGKLVAKSEISSADDATNKVQDATNQRLEKEIADLKSLVKTQQDKVRSLERRTEPHALAARGFDKILEWIERGSQERVRMELANLNEEAIFSGDNPDGGALVRDLVLTSEALSKFKTSQIAGTPDPATLTEARKCLERATAGKEDFILASNEWYAEDAEGIDADQRDKNLEHCLGTLAQQVSEYEGHMRTSFAAELESILAGGATQDPSRAFQFTNLAPPDLLDNLLRKFVDALQADYESAGQLNVDALGNLGALQIWGSYLDQPETAGTLHANNVATLRLFRTAQVWHTGTDEEREALVHGIAIPAIPAGPAIQDWRASLALELALHQSKSYPLPQGRVAVYLQTNTQNDSKVWIIAKGLKTQEDGTEYVNENRPFTIDQFGGVVALDKRKATTFFANWKYQFAEEDRLDLLAANSNVQVINWDQLAVENLPNDGSFPSASKHTQFQEEFNSAAHPCLVQVHDEFTGWYSPVYGLVHYEKGSVVRDLVYLEQ